MKISQTPDGPSVGWGPRWFNAAIMALQPFDGRIVELLRTAVRRPTLRDDVRSMRERMRAELSKSKAGEFDLKQDAAKERLLSDHFEHGKDIGNREYRPGDPMKRIDFKAWARLECEMHLTQSDAPRQKVEATRFGVYLMGG